MTAGRLPPSRKDEGYAWVIVFSTFFLQAIGDGVRFCYGLMFVEFLEEFQGGKSETAWIGSLMLGLLNLGAYFGEHPSVLRDLVFKGPVSAFLINKIGYRIGTMAGSVITALALILSSFARSLTYLYFFYGVLHGFGSGLYFLGGTVATGKYFRKKKALAIGITFCGGGIGTFVILPLTRIIIDYYTWRGAMFILAGIVLQGCVFAALFRPFIDDESNENYSGEKDCKSNQNSDDLSVSQKTALLEDNPGGNCMTLDRDENICKQKPFKSLTDIRIDRPYLQKSEVLFYSSRSLNMIPVVDLSKDVEAVLKTKDVISGDTAAGADTFRNKFVEGIFPKALVTNSSFIILMLSTVFIAIPEFVPYSMLPDFGLDVGCKPSQTAWFLSVLGIFSMVSNVGAGWLADRPCVHNLSFLGGCILTVGVITMVIAVIPSLETFFIYCALYGTFAAAMYGVQLVVLMEFFGEDNLPTSLGITMWVYGVSGLIGTPAAGWLFDITGSYKVSFLATGACFVLSGLINFLVLCTKTSKNIRKAKAIKATKV